MAMRVGGPEFWKGIFFSNSTKSPVDRAWCAFSSHIEKLGACIFAMPLKRCPLEEKEKGSHRSQPLGRAAAQLQGDSAAGGDEVQGAKLLFQHERKDKAGNVIYSPSPAQQCHHFAVVPCLFNSVSCLWTPPETCQNLNMLSGTSAQELPPKPQQGWEPWQGWKEGSDMMMLFYKQVSIGHRHETTVNACWDLTLKLRASASGGNVCIFFHWVPFDILKAWQELRSQGIHWSYFCGCLYPGSIWRRWFIQLLELMGLCVTYHCKKKGLICYHGLVWANFGIDLAWKKCLTQQDSSWSSFFHAGCWCLESPRQEILSSNIKQMFFIVVQLHWLPTCSVKHSRGTQAFILHGQQFIKWSTWNQQQTF